jgi:hypothetical protein
MSEELPELTAADRISPSFKEMIRSYIELAGFDITEMLGTEISVGEIANGKLAGSTGVFLPWDGSAIVVSYTAYSRQELESMGYPIVEVQKSDDGSSEGATDEANPQND